MSDLVIIVWVKLFCFHYFIIVTELSSGSDTSCSHAPAQTCLVSKYDAINNNENCNAAAAFMFWMAMCMNYKAMQAAKRLEKFRYAII